MYEKAYDLTDSERREVEELLAGITLRGGRLTDDGGRPIPYRVLRGRRYLMCDKGMVWQFAPAGAPQVPGQAVGVCRRNSAVAMWTGRWRKQYPADGLAKYAKCIVWVPLDDHINGHPGVSKLGWYRAEKGFRHPYEGPQAPSAADIAALESRGRDAEQAVFVRMQQEGLRVSDAPLAVSRAEPSAVSNAEPSAVSNAEPAAAAAPRGAGVGRAHNGRYTRAS
jgi:hypothetical protein